MLSLTHFKLLFVPAYYSVFCWFFFWSTELEAANINMLDGQLNSETWNRDMKTPCDKAR